ncbi:hypothetical protein ACFSKW_42690 [Nonomuraea mangrovi]|uniref:Uncharacterized protein n=2 Tax=Nonomuraea TaxID=83681 RepID=A0ABW4T8X4_9ACTN
MLTLILLIDAVLALAGLLLTWLFTRPHDRAVAAVPPRRAIRVARQDRNRSLFVARPPAQSVAVGLVLARHRSEPGPFVVA